MANNLSERLKSIRSEIQEFQGARVDAMKERDSARDAWAGTDFSQDVKLTETNEFKAAEEAVKRVGELDDKINDRREAEKAILKMLGQDSVATNTTGLGGGGAADITARGWDGRHLIENSDEFRAALDHGVFNSGHQFGTVQIGQICDRDNFVEFIQRPSAANLPAAPAGTVGTDQGAIRPDVRGIIPPFLLPLTLLDLFPTGTTDSNIIQYVQVTAIPGSAAETAELSLKPQEGITLSDQTAPVRTIAGWIKLARQSMDDIPALATMVNSLLPNDVRRRLMTQMLVGDGVGQNLLGILNTTGIGAPASAAGDNVLDGILRAITTVVLSDADPNFIALNPLTWQNIAIMKASGSGEYMLADPGGVQAAYGAQSIWGLRVAQNRAIPQTKPLVGDSMGASLLVREGVNIKTSDSDQDDFVRNRVTVLAETRVAFPIWRPSGFALAPLG